jgi:hypothetical protein
MLDPKKTLMVTVLCVALLSVVGCAEDIVEENNSHDLSTRAVVSALIIGDVLSKQ